jgi:hypothetical protein
MLALLADPGDALRPYVRMEKGAPQSKWSPLDQSLAWGACFLWEYGKPNAAVLERCPATAQALSGIPQSIIPGRAPTAFFSILKPRTRIPPHTGVTNTRAIVHLPLIVPDGCGFGWVAKRANGRSARPLRLTIPSSTKRGTTATRCAPS